MTRRIVLEGEKGAIAALKEVEKSINPKISNNIIKGSLRTATRKEAVPILERHVRNRKQGFLGKAQSTTGPRVPQKFREVRNQTDQFEAAVFMVGRSAPLIHLMEFGTAAHTIIVNTKKVLSNWMTSMGKGPERTFGKVVRHPGARATPTHAPAAAEAGPKVYAEFFVAAERRLRRLSNALNSKYGKLRPSLKSNLGG